MNSSSITNANQVAGISMNTNSLDAPSGPTPIELTIGTVNADSTKIGRLTKTTNLAGNVQINGSSGASGNVLTSTGSTTAPTWQALPTPYISASGVASGTVNMDNFSIINSNGLDASGIPVAIGQGSASLGVSIGRATQTTNLNGNIQFNSLIKIVIQDTKGKKILCKTLIQKDH
jgi:hypothetical protein